MTEHYISPDPFMSEDRQHWQMRPAQLRAIRMDMGMNMTAMGLMLQDETGARISRNKYRDWERPKTRKEWRYIPPYAAEAVHRCYSAFLDYVDTLVAMYDGESPLALVHRNDKFHEAQLDLPPHISVHNYNQAVGKAWAKIRSQGYEPELTYFTTDLTYENYRELPARTSRSSPYPPDDPRNPSRIPPKQM